MNYRMLAYIIGTVLKAEAMFLTPSMCVALYYGETKSAIAFLITIGLLLLIGVPVSFKRPADTVMFAREGFASVALSWIAMSLFGALPYYFSGAIPSYIDAFFETVSGFSTTGASILTDIEIIPKGLLFWRSFTHWIGGMGALLFILAIMSSNGGYFLHLMRAESPGPSIKKFVPRLSDNAKILYSLYIMLTAAEVIMLLLGGMSLYESFVYAFSTAGTGGFACRNDSLASYSPYIQWVITAFMLLFGVNFNVYYLLIIRKFSTLKKNTEVRVYFAVVLLSTALISLNLYGSAVDGMSLGDTVRHAAFQVASVITTTGFATKDFNLWPSMSQMILLLLMFMGACAGSTGGGSKVSRVMIFVKSAFRSLRRIIHPRSVELIKLDGETVEEETVSGISAFIALYIGIALAVAAIISMFGYDVLTSLTAAFTTIGNVGPGLSLVGPAANYSFFQPVLKLLLSFNMLVGRLEIFPVLIMLTPSIWTRAHKGHGDNKA